MSMFLTIILMIISLQNYLLLLLAKYNNDISYFLTSLHKVKKIAIIRKLQDKINHFQSLDFS